MSKEKKGIVESSVDAAKSLVPQTVEQTDGVLSTVVGFFNNVVLYPLKKANLTFKYKLEAFEQDLKKNRNYSDRKFAGASAYDRRPRVGSSEIYL